MYYDEKTYPHFSHVAFVLMVNQINTLSSCSVRDRECVPGSIFADLISLDCNFFRAITLIYRHKMNKELLGSPIYVIVYRKLQP